jgi:hypothetical protein
MDRLRSDDITALTTRAHNHTDLKTPRTWTRALRVEDAGALFVSIKNLRVYKWVSVSEQPCPLSTLRRWIAVRVARMKAGEVAFARPQPARTRPFCLREAPRSRAPLLSSSSSRVAMARRLNPAFVDLFLQAQIQ